MGNKQNYQFSKVTQSTFDPKKYEGMWYKVHSSDVDDTSCDSTVLFHFYTGEVLNITSYCIVKSRLVKHEQKYATVPNKFEPCKFTIKSEGILGTQSKYWIYYTDYVTYALIGDGTMNKYGNGSNYVVLSRTPKVTKELTAKIQAEIIKHAI